MTVEYTYESVKENIAVSGLVPTINKMFGSNIKCDSAAMFGDKPIDDNLLYEVANTVCLAVRRGDITREEAKAVVAPAYEMHSEIDPVRFDNMVSKGKNIVYQVLSDDKIRKDVDDFKQIWGDEALSLKDYERYSPYLIDKRRKTLPEFEAKILPDFFKVCGVYPSYKIDTQTASGDNAACFNSIENGQINLYVEFYFSDFPTVFQTALDLMSSVAHELHHCSQYQIFYNTRRQNRDYWCISQDGKRIPQEIIWERTNGSNYSLSAGLNNPLEHEAYTIQNTVGYFMEEYYLADSNSERRAVVESAKRPSCSLARKEMIEDRIKEWFGNIYRANQR